MSYLLTEIAMEMLGWQFYDTNGVPRPINLEGLNLAKTEGAPPLEQALDINFLDEKFSVKAEADSSVENETNAEIKEDAVGEIDEKLGFSYTIDDASQETYGESEDSKSSELQSQGAHKFNWNLNDNTNPDESLIINNVSNNSFNLKIESVVGGFSLENESTTSKLIDDECSFYAPLKITKMQTSPDEDLTCLEELNVKQLKSPLIPDSEKTLEKNFSPNWNVISTTKTPIFKNSAHPTDGPGTSGNKSQTDCSNFELQQKLENEMSKTVLDLNREKALYLKSLDRESKKSILNFRKTSEMYCKQEFDNLQNELKNLFQLRQHAEQLSATKFPKTYPKYLIRSNALNSDELLQSANLKMLL